MVAAGAAELAGADQVMLHLPARDYEEANRDFRFCQASGRVGKPAAPSTLDARETARRLRQLKAPRNDKRETMLHQTIAQFKNPRAWLVALARGGVRRGLLAGLFLAVRLRADASLHAGLLAEHGVGRRDSIAGVRPLGPIPRLVALRDLCRLDGAVARRGALASRFGRGELFCLSALGNPSVGPGTQLPSDYPHFGRGQGELAVGSRVAPTGVGRS